MGENTEGENFSVPDTPPPGGFGRSGMLNRFIDEADRAAGFPTTDHKTGKLNNDAGEPAGRDDRGRFQAKRAEQDKRGAEPEETEAEGLDDDELDDDELEDREEDDEDIADEATDSEDDDDAGSDESQAKRFADLAKTAGLSPEDLRDMVFETRIDGQAVEVPYHELLKGYRRQKDVTRGFQEVSAAKRDLSAYHETSAHKLGEHIDSSVAYLQALDKELRISKDRLESLKGRPHVYAAAVERNQSLERALQEGVESVRQLQARQQEETSAADKIRRSREFDLFLDRNPQYNDPRRLKALGSKISAFMGDHGFDDAEIDDISDHRMVEVIMKAMKSDRKSNARQGLIRKEVKKTESRNIRSKARPGKVDKQAIARDRAAQGVASGKAGAFANWLQLSGRV
jgi:hypothetical protein